jgi:hypothetical protein
MFRVEAASATIVDNIVTWSGPTTLGIGVVYRHDIALSSDGTKAVYVSAFGLGFDQPSNFAATATIVNNVATWSPPQEILGPYVASVRLALSSDGSTAMIMWDQHDCKQCPGNMLAATAIITDNLAIWSPPIYLAASTGDYDFGMASDGTKAVAIWKCYNNIYICSATAQVVNNMATWGSPEPFVSGHVVLLELSDDATKAIAMFIPYNSFNLQATTGSFS